MVPKVKKYISLCWQNWKILTIVQGPWNWGGLTWWTLFFGTYSIVTWQALSLSLYGTRVHWPQENGLGHLLALLGNVTKNLREKPNICPTLVPMHNSIGLTSLLTYRLDRRPNECNIVWASLVQALVNLIWQVQSALQIWIQWRQKSDPTLEQTHLPSGWLTEMTHNPTNV